MCTLCLLCDYVGSETLFRYGADHIRSDPSMLVDLKWIFSIDLVQHVALFSQSSLWITFSNLCFLIDSFKIQVFTQWTRRSAVHSKPSRKVLKTRIIKFDCWILKVNSSLCSGYWRFVTKQVILEEIRLGVVLCSKAACGRKTCSYAAPCNLFDLIYTFACGSKGSTVFVHV